MPPKNDIFQTFDLKWSPCTSYDDILAKVDYIEQTGAGLKIHCHKVKKEKKMNKNEELKHVDTIIISREGNTVSLTAYDEISGFDHPVVCHKTIAECSPDDVFDFNIGAKIAFDRLYEGYDMTSKKNPNLYSGKIVLIDTKHEGNKCRFGTAVYTVIDGIIPELCLLTLGKDLRIEKNMTCSDLYKRVTDMYFNYGCQFDKVMYVSGFNGFEL